MQPRALLDGLAMPESPRWHDGRLWFSNWGTRQIVAVDLDGNSEVVGEGPDGLGWATNWLPDGRLLIAGPELIRVEPDGSLANRRVWADGVGPDGICLDADGCIWASSGNMANDCARIREGGEVLERIDLGRPCFATMLGGPDRRTLFMLVADWHGTEGVENVVKARTGQVLVADAPAPGVGWP